MYFSFPFLTVIALLTFCVANGEHAHSHDESAHSHAHSHSHDAPEVYQPPAKNRKDGITPLMGAILKNQVTIVHRLLEEGDVDINAQNEKG